jgi:acetyltransferase-like isoleucine patch superfamily enzyme
VLGNTAFLQLVNLLFNFMPLTRWYKLRAYFLRLAGVDCAKTARIIASARIIIKNVSIGEDAFIGHQVLITGEQDSRINLGNNVDIAPRVVIISGSHEIDMLSAHSAGPGKGGEVWIQDGAWIGANSTILPGVTIGCKSVIGAGSVVTRDIPPYCVAVGNPCVPIKRWNSDLNRLERIED